ncbi:MAG: class I SAM-dependent methyltransferase [Polyangiaceae bacterium]
MLERILRNVFRIPALCAPMDPSSGYDLWSSTYDSDNGNLLIDLDELMFAGLLKRLPLHGKLVADVGCGTGRHWKKILAEEPAELTGHDASKGMLRRLRRKYPDATVHHARAESLVHADASCDVVVSTLALSHVAVAEDALTEWCRILRPGGDILLTDFHPGAAATCECSFRHRGQVRRVKSYVHSIPSLRSAAAQNRLELLHFEETLVDDSMQRYYERQNMLPVFARMKGVPLLYGMHLRKLELRRA